ncbi:hypothetical protein [Accumulibacter sp.]|nr:hypothetical protein [Accumulibacter sp.]
MGNIRHQSSQRAGAAENIREERGLSDVEAEALTQFKPLPG